MSSHGGGRRNNRGDGPYDSRRGRDHMRPDRGERGRGDGRGERGRGDGRGERGRGDRRGERGRDDRRGERGRDDRRGERGRGQPESIMEYYLPNPSQAGSIWPIDVDESSSCQASMPPMAAPSALTASTSAGSSLPPASSKALVHKFRPGFGKVGTEYLVCANHFYVQTKTNKIFQYEIKIQQEVKSKALSRAVMKKLFEQFGASNLGNRKAVYDGCNILYTARSFPFQSEDFTLNLPDRNGQDKIYIVSIRFIRERDLDYLQQFLSARQWECPYDVIAALDVVLRESPSNSHLTISRSFFSPEIDESDNPPKCYNYWKGFFQSLRPTQMGLSLNVDVQAAPFYKPINLLTFFEEYLNNYVNDVDSIGRQHADIEGVLKGVRVETTHMPNMRRRYRITGITRESADELMFTLDGIRKSVANYFRDRYPDARINFKLPCIKAGSDNNPKYLPIQVCQIVERHRYIKKLSSDQVIRILQIIGDKPSDRKRNIFQTVQRNNYNYDQYVNEFHISVERKLVRFGARLLPPPTLQYNDTRGAVKQIEPRDGQWNMSNTRMLSGGTVNAWACINFSRVPQNQGDACVEAFLDILVNTCNSVGMNFSPDPVYSMYQRPAVIEDSLRELHRRHEKLQLLIVILPEEKGSSYGMIKTICETELGIVTQCCQPHRLKYTYGTYFINLAMKINVKVAGCNTTLHTKNPLISNKSTIIFGADVTHASPGDDSPSIAAVVASMDWPEATNYKALVSAQPRGQEIIDNLFRITRDDKSGSFHGGMIWELIRAFFQKTKQKPERIIFYRDGVSEGQFQEVLSSEIHAIRKACAFIENGYSPSITFIVVQKRHHTRLFPVENEKLDKSGNICAGTVVDKYICHPSDFDFYLCSHAGLKGTSRPAHYVVLYDENKFSADELQRLSNDLCYTYARCTRSVSVAPPALYAHLAAFRARYYMEEARQRGRNSATVPKIKEQVSNVMFFC